MTENEVKENRERAQGRGRGGSFYFKLLARDGLIQTMS